MRPKASEFLVGGRSTAADSLPAEIDFLVGYGVPPEPLRAAADAAVLTGVGADIALIASGCVSEIFFYRCLADRLGLPYFEGKPPMAADCNDSTAIRAGVALLAPNALRLRAAMAPSGRALSLLIAATATGRPVRDIAICSPRRLASLIRAQAARRIAHSAAEALGERDPSLTARRGASPDQVAAASLFMLAAIALGLFSPKALRFAICGLLLLLFTGAIWLRSIALAAGRASAAIEPLQDAALPRYTVVVALRQESAVVPHLLRALDAIDYPRGKLDIKIVVEADDFETREAVEALRPPPRYDLIVAPMGAPMTKPRALNVALREARGELLTVYDAEDIPASDQLRRAAERFAADPGVDCLQARLVIDNSSDSWLSACFALEYAALFDLVNPGLAALDLPIALGGTSNHFQTRALRRIGGWDAWSVTEDADLGIRLARFGSRVGALDSDTCEEAPWRLRNWFRQRVRWQKGWMQTLVTHTRSPRRVLAELGALRALAAFLTIAGTVTGSLFGAPLFLATLTRDLFMPAESGAFARAIDVATYVLVLWGAQNVIVPALIAQRRRRIPRVYRALAMMPVYYGLIFVASWVALFDWFVRPSYWAKTEHGLRKRCADINATSPACAPPNPPSAPRTRRASPRPAAAAR